MRTDVELSGALTLPHPVHVDVSRSPLTFTATDDRGNLYLGRLGNWNGNDSRLDGTLEFWPGLDPQAVALGITITADRAQAVVRTPLRWESPA